MAKRRGWLGIGVILFLVSVSLIYVQGQTASPSSEELESVVGTTLNDIEFKSNRFTQPDSQDESIESIEVGSEYTLIAESEELSLFVNEENAAIKIQDKRSDYVWSSTPTAEDMEVGSLNAEWQGNVMSPVLVRYVTTSAQIRSGSLSTLEGEIVEFEEIDQGFRAQIVLEGLEASFELIVKLDEGALVVQVPDESIQEEGTMRLQSIQMYPFLGATKGATVPGYMFVPDGSGALIRYQEGNTRYDEPFSRYIYGSDPSLQTRFFASSFLQPVTLPVFGMVHGEDQHGYVAIVEDGKYQAEIMAYPSGITTDMNWVSARFTLRHVYFQPTSRNMGGINSYQRERSKEDKQVRYLFLTGDEANYGGMAKAYREYLIERQALPEKTQANEDIPLRVEFLGAEVEPGMIRQSLVQMTTFEQVQTIIQALEERDISNIRAVYQGWSKGGYSGRNPDKFPVERSLGGKAGLEELQEFFADREASLFLGADYTSAFEKAKQFNPRSDAVRRITNHVLSRPLGNEVSSSQIYDIDVYYMNPQKAYELAQEDVQEFGELGIEGIAATQLATELFSDYHQQQRMSRKETATAYTQLAELLRVSTGELAVYSAHDFLLPFADELFDAPMSSSQYMYVTDAVPFLQMVLHGSVNYYVSPINFQANPEEQVLRMVEYGAYPSYYLTYEHARLLRNTASSHIFTSEYMNWLNTIQSHYSRVNQALRHVQSATMEERSVLDWGVVQVQYSNGVQIFVNYTGDDFQVEGTTIPARDFLVIGGEDQ
ncbi:DUF5696 domain-containing protein [Bacillus horti]|uniref:Uncharacterized protein n=1 Tax=Caldalkalibacillus horti TaxID=77523 RepID=A0ABT9W588_9BACI|nr:DUF5696 domain-containing protein [Bacillus horti]MDQ0168408.1 hypothetical protein [Bacillus horti]